VQQLTRLQLTLSVARFLCDTSCSDYECVYTSVSWSTWTHAWRLRTCTSGTWSTVYVSYSASSRDSDRALSPPPACCQTTSVTCSSLHGHSTTQPTRPHRQASTTHASLTLQVCCRAAAEFFSAAAAEIRNRPARWETGRWRGSVSRPWDMEIDISNPLCLGPVFPSAVYIRKNIIALSSDHVSNE